jgi:hypothetical protein
MDNKEIFDENGYLIDKFIEKKCLQLQKISLEIAKYSGKIKLNGRTIRALENAITDFVIGKIQMKRFEIVEKNLMKPYRKKKVKK